MDINYIKPLLESKLISLGYTLSSINTKRERGDNYLSIVIDRVEPIDMNTIVEVSGILSAYLDEIDNSNDPYILDVSSLGAEKELSKDSLSSYIGSYVELRLINPIEGENIYFGTIKGVEGNRLELEFRIKTRTKVIITDISNINKVRLAIKF